MTVEEYSELTEFERLVGFIVKLLPFGGELLTTVNALKGVSLEFAPHKIKDKLWRGPQPLATLKAMAEEADAKGWRPTEDYLSAHLTRFGRCGLDRQGLAQALAARLPLVDLVRWTMKGELPARVTALGENDSPYEGHYANAIHLLFESLDGEPEWGDFARSWVGRHLIHAWLLEAIFTGRDVRGVLQYLHRHLRDGLQNVHPELLRTYSSYCVWYGWREGLEPPIVQSDSFARGCLKVLDGDLPAAYRLFSEHLGYHGDFASGLLVHSVCMAVKPADARTKVAMKNDSYCRSEVLPRKWYEVEDGSLKKHEDVVEAWYG